MLMLLLLQVSDQVLKVSERMHDRAKRVVSAVAASSLVRWASDQVDAPAWCVVVPILTHARTPVVCGAERHDTMHQIADSMRGSGGEERAEDEDQRDDDKHHDGTVASFARVREEHC